ncbi:MAG TPA: sialidase family protein, partial [Actinomycetes bacterium]|nr:sialidase family protein [Actinomycetes bacterium]
FSFDSGDHWTQPTYSGYSARVGVGGSCLGQVGPDPGCVPLTPEEGGQIGTLPWYYENGLVSDGDPAVAFGPRPDANGDFSWANGSRLYYANLTANFSAKRSEAGFKGVEAIGVSRTDNPQAAAAGVKSAWLPPSLITGSNSAAAFADKEQIWADNAASSRFFGNTYVCFARYVGGPSAGSNAHTLDVARSTDGGDSWTKLTLVGIPGSSSGKFALFSGHSGCTIRTDSTGTVHVFWLGWDQRLKQQGIYTARSVDGGASFEEPRRLFLSVNTGILDPVLGRTTMDGIAGARSDLSNAPSVDIANGAPTGADATDQLALTWVDGRDGLNNEHVFFTTSTNDGQSWTGLRTVENEIGHPADRGYYSAPAISPDGRDIYLVYNAFLEPYKQSTIGAANDRPLVGVVTHAEVAAGGTVGAFSQLHRSPPGDARGSSQNDLTAEFLGDYVYAAATRDYGVAVWNDVRNAADCAAIDAWRMSLRTGEAVPRPAPQQDCPATFGNSDIFGGSYADPTTP